MDPIVGKLLATAVVRGGTETKRRVVRRLREQQYSAELGPVETVFNDTLEAELRAVAKRSGNDELLSIAFNWEAFAPELDSLDVLVEEEAEAIDRIASAIVGMEDVELTETTEEELKTGILEAYRAAVEAFHERVVGTEVGDLFQQELDLDVARGVSEAIDRLDRIETRLGPTKHYDVFDVREELDAALDAIQEGAQPTFVDRPELDGFDPVGWTLVVGPAGSGKTRVLMELVRGLHHEDVQSVVIPDQMQFTGDETALERERFDGDVLLVWDDVHYLNERRDNSVFESAVSKLERSLVRQGHSLTVLATARSGNIDDLPGLHSGSSRFWGDFDRLLLSDLDVELLSDLIDAMADFYGVSVDSDAADTLVEKALDTASAPEYLETAFETAEGGELTVAHVETLAESVEEIWREQYSRLKETDEHAWFALVAMKLLFDVSIPHQADYVQGVYEHVLDRDIETFRDAVDSLRDRQWLRASDADLTAEETSYYVHDTQLEAISERIDEYRRIAKLSTFLMTHLAVCPDSETGGLGEYASPRTSLDDSELPENHHERAVLHTTFAYHLDEQWDQPTDVIRVHLEEALCSPELS